MDTRQQRKRMSSENRGQTGLGYVESRLRKTIVNPTVSTDDWYTPRWIIDTLGPFDCDPCAPPAEVRPYEIAPTAYTRDDDGLSREWHGTVWLNPPYSRVLLRRFCERMAAHGNGIALLVNRQDNLLWQEVIFPTAKSMIFMRHRVKFLRPVGSKRQSRAPASRRHHGLAVLRFVPRGLGQRLRPPAAGQRHRGEICGAEYVNERRIITNRHEFNELWQSTN